MIKFQKQQSPEHVWVVAWDTLCDGTDCYKDEDGNIALFNRQEAVEELAYSRQLEIEAMREYYGDRPFDEESVEIEDFMIHMDEYVHNRRVFFPGGITGVEPLKQ